MGPAISYVPFEQMDERMKAEMERCAKHGTPRPESSAVRAHSPAAFWAFADSWQAQFRTGVVDHAIKDLCRVYISQDRQVRVLRQPAVGEGHHGRPAGTAVRRTAQLRDVRPLRRPPEGRARLRRGHRVGQPGPRRTLGPSARPLHRAGTGRARLLHFPDLRSAELDSPARHRSSPVHGRHLRVDGARVRDGRPPGCQQGGRRLLGRQQPGLIERRRGLLPADRQRPRTRRRRSRGHVPAGGVAQRHRRQVTEVRLRARPVRGVRGLDRWSSDAGVRHPGRVRPR